MKNKIIIAVISALLILSCALIALGDSTDVTNDPLISLSYVKEVLIPEIDRKIETAIEGASFDKVALSDDRIAEEASKPDRKEPDTDVSAPASVGTYEVLKLELGDIIMATEPCEIIIRSGSVDVFLNGVDSSIADLTDGTELWEGSNVALNHLLLIPRGDGRGFKIMSSESYVMVRGGYKVENELKAEVK